MSKVAKVVGAIGLGVGLAWATGGLSAAWMAGAKATLTGTIGGQLLTSVAATALSSALAGKPSSGQSAGIRAQDAGRGDINPDSFVLGRYAVKGSHVCPPYSHSIAGYKTPNPIMNQVIHLGGRPGQKLVGMMIDGKAVEITDQVHPDYGREIGIDGRTGYARVRFYDGTQTAADPMLVSRYRPPHARPWTTDMVGTGICYAVMTYGWWPEGFQGFPQATFILDGAGLYDPRRDSSVGGNGPQRWSQPATWEGSENPAVQIYNLLRGVTLPGGVVYGGRARADQLPLPNWMAAMDACDRPVTNADGTTEPAWRTSYEVMLSDEPAGVIEELAKAASIQLTESGGTWRIRVGGPGVPVAHMTDGDIVTTANQMFDMFPTLENTFNGVSASFPDPASGWEAVEAPLYIRSDYVAADRGKELFADLTLAAAPYAMQVQRLARAYVEEERRFRRHVLVLPPDYGALEPLDAITWTSERNGYIAKVFEVAATTTNPVTQLVSVTLRERDPEDYDWKPGFELPYTPTPIVWGDVPQIEMAHFDVEGAFLPDGDGKPRRPVLVLSWDTDELEPLSSVHWEVRLQGSAEVLRDIAIPMAGQAIVRDVLPDQVYEARIRPDLRGYDPQWTAWKMARTPNIRLGRDDVAYDELTEEVRGSLEELRDWAADNLNGLTSQVRAEVDARLAAIADLADTITAESDARAEGARTEAARFRSILDQMEGLKTYVAALSYESYAQINETRRVLAAIDVGGVAGFEERITAAASAVGALAERVVTLTAENDRLSSQILAVDTARVDGEEALARQISGLSVGTVTQFDTAVTWYFDREAEGWSGGAVVVPGYLRPATLLVSPDGLAVDVARYEQVRMRLRRSGTPAWSESRIEWREVGQDWDGARQAAIPEPVWGEGNAGLVTLTLQSSALVDQLRLVLPTGGAGYVEIDWIGIGRPAPGASSADLISERRARITADEALASDLTGVEARLTDTDGRLTGTVQVVEGIESRVRETETGLLAQGQALETMQVDLGGKASVELVDQRIGEIEATGAVGISALAGQMALIRNEQVPLALDVVDAAYAAYLRDMDGRKIVAETLQEANTRIDQTAERLAVTAEQLRQVRTELPGLATGRALDVLRSTVSMQGDTLAVQNTALTRLTADLAGKAGAEALDSLTLDVRRQGQDVSAQGDQLARLRLDVDGKATQTSMTALTGRVDATERGIEAQGSALTDVLSELGEKASSRAVNDLATRVRDTEGDIRAQGDSLTRLDTRVGNVWAEGLLRITTEAGIGGATSRIALAAAAGANSATPSRAGIYLQAASGGRSEALVDADLFGVVSGDTSQRPFIVAGGRVYMDAAFVRDLSIGTAKIGDNAITIPVSQYLTGSIIGGGGEWREANSVIVTLPARADMSVIWTGQHFYQNGFASPGLGVRIRVNGDIRSVRITGNQGDVGNRQDFMVFAASFTLPAGRHAIAVEWFGGQAGPDLHLAHRALICISSMK
ncbi:phage tail protein [Falsirhodobacter halotolerans]|uniref:phage tail protein n=1 Tax=Falsirhodobacter halotolerans TaxID=1146892 RepID=UPI001FD0AD97|nr:phage tail protein [Falsirhodobacter halotolerans]MCJ8139522.1 phage tail protein [Falsirhodobacter halotolerans]